MRRTLQRSVSPTRSDEGVSPRGPLRTPASRCGLGRHRGLAQSYHPKGVNLSLTAPERETVITFSDEDDTATVHTHQRRIITKLRNNPAASELEDLTFQGTAGAVFEIPADLISFRSGRRKLSPEQARAAAANL